MHSSATRIQQALAISIGLLGLFVLLGWLFGNHAMVKIVPGSVAMTFNTALLFFLAGCCLWPARFEKAQLACACALVLLPSLILGEHITNLDFGIDWAWLHAGVGDGNQHPGRTAPNTCIGFLFVGIACLLLGRVRHQLLGYRVIAILTALVFALGLVALLGYVLNFEAMYRMAQFNGMAAPTAAGMLLVATALRARLAQLGHPEHVSYEQRIARTAALMLTIVALVTGMTGFVIVKQGVMRSLSDGMLNTTENSAAAFAATIEQHLVMVTTIAARPALQGYLERLNEDRNDAGALERASEVGNSFLASGVTGMRFYNEQGAHLLAIGTNVRPAASMSMVLGSADQGVVLFWHDGFVLWAEKSITRHGRVVGKFTSEQRMPRLMDMLAARQVASISADALVCGRSNERAVCFPSRFYRAGLNFQMFKNGQPYLAASRALLMQRGVLEVNDARGVPVLAGYAPIGKLGLGMVVKQDLTDLHAPFRDSFHLLLGMLIAMVAIGTWMLRGQVQPLTEKLGKEQRRMQMIISSSHDAFIEIDQAGTITEWNVAAERTFGWPRQEAIGRQMAQLIVPPSMRQSHHDGLACFLRSGKSVVAGKRMELPAMRRDGTQFLIELSITASQGEQGYSFAAFLHDISERIAADAALWGEKERLRVTLSSIGDAVITTDMAGIVIFLNPVAEKMTGWPCALATGLPLATVFNITHEDSGEVAPNPVLEVLATGETVTLTKHTVLIARAGQRFSIEVSAAPIKDPAEQVIGVVLVFHDVSEARNLAAQMTHQATHDALTGLINRREFEHRVKQALLTGEPASAQHTVLYLDLDKFKVVNDSCGHLAGDELLRQLTALLDEKLRKADTLARLGGDEFGVLLENCEVVAAARVAELLRQTVDDFHFAWQDRVFPIGVSIGLVTFDSAGTTLADVLRMADAACYVAKEKGRNQVHVFAATDEELARRNGEMGWIARIGMAFEDDRLTLYSQEISALCASADGGDHYELLLRMRDDDGSLIAPMAFIPAAERYGLMARLDRWVIEAAFAQHAIRHPTGAAHGTCSINLSASSICDDQFAAFVTAQFARYALDPRAICFEIRASAAIANLSRTAALILRLRALGCRFSLDDFGSGMSSFSYLKHLPVNYLKIDGGFVRDMLNDPIDRAMVESIHRIGQVMGMQTIAKFVESDALRDAVRDIGVDFAQGYGVERPRPAFVAPRAPAV